MKPLSLLKTRKRKALALLLAALLAGGTLAWYLWPPGFYGDGRVRATVTATIIGPSNDRPDVAPGRPAAWSDDLRHVAYAVERDGGIIVVRDGVEGVRYDDIFLSYYETHGRLYPASPGLMFSPDGQHLAYAAERGERWLIVVDGAESAEYDDVLVAVTHPMDPPPDEGFFGRSSSWGECRAADMLAWTDDGRVAFTAKRDGKSLVVVDGKEYSAGGEPLAAGLAVSPRGDRFACAVRVGERCRMLIDGALTGDEFAETPWQSDGGSSVWFDERDGRCYAWLLPDDPSSQDTGLLFVDGVNTHCDFLTGRYDGRLAYALRTPDGASWMIIDGRRLGPYGNVAFTAASDDGARLVFAAQRDGKWFVVDNGIESSPYDDIRWQATVTPDGGRLIYIAMRGGKWWVVDNGRETGPYDAARLFAARLFTYSGPSRPYAGCEVKRDGRVRVVYNGVEGPAYDAVAEPAVSADGRRLAYAAERGGGWYVVIDGVETPAEPRVITHGFSPDGSRLAWTEGADEYGDGGGRVSVDGRRWRVSGDFDDFLFSPDGRHLACTLSRPRPEWMINAMRALRRVINCDTFARSEDDEFLVVDGAASRRYSHVYTPFFTPDSRHVICLARRGTIPVILVDGRETDYLKPYDSWPVRYDRTPTGFVLVFAHDNNFVRVEMTFESLD